MGPGSYLTLPQGAAVHDRLGARVGTVERVLCHDDGRFDGLVVSRAGLSFIDAPEVRRVVEASVVLEVTRSEVDNGVSKPQTHRDSGSDACVDSWVGPSRMPSVRRGRADATEEDRLAVVERLKAAYVFDRLTIDELADLVALTHGAETVPSSRRCSVSLTVEGPAREPL